MMSHLPGLMQVCCIRGAALEYSVTFFALALFVLLIQMKIYFFNFQRQVRCHTFSLSSFSLSLSSFCQVLTHLCQVLVFVTYS